MSGRPSLGLSEPVEYESDSGSDDSGDQTAAGDLMSLIGTNGPPSAAKESYLGFEDDEDFEDGSPTDQGHRRFSISRFSREADGQDTSRKIEQFALNATSLRKGKNLAKFPTRGELEVCFVLQFQQLPEPTSSPATDVFVLTDDIGQGLDTVSIFQVTIDGNLNSSWPGMKALLHRVGDREWLELISFVKLGGALVHVKHEIEMAQAMHPLAVRVAVKLIRGKDSHPMVQLTTDVEGVVHFVERAQGAAETLVPEQAIAHAYFSSPLATPASAHVSEGQYTTYIPEPPSSDLQAQDHMLLPPRVYELKAQDEEEQKWVWFDAFFGFIVIINGVWIGIEVANDVSSLWSNIVNNVFLGIFMIELGLRYRKSQKRLGAFIHDSWILLDIVIVLAGLYGAFIESNSENSGPFPPTVLRLARLLRLGRMVRLMQLFRSLGLLVDTMLSATQVVLWTLLLLMLFVYAIGIVMVRLKQLADDSHSDWSPEQRAILDEWDGVPESMWNIMQMVTADGWADYVRDLAFTVGRGEGVTMALVMVFMMIVAFIGIMNMVVALLCRTAFQLHRRQREMSAAKALLDKKKNMQTLRAVLKERLNENVNTFAQKAGFNKTALGELYDHDAEVRRVFKSLDITRNHINDFQRYFHGPDGMLDLESMFEVIGTLQLDLFNRAADAQKYLFGADLLGKLRPPDMLAYNCSLSFMEETTHTANRHVMGICTLLHNLNETLHQVMAEAGAHLTLEGGMTPRIDVGKELESSKQDIRATRACWETHLKGVDLEATEAKLSVQIDVIAALVIVLNAIVIGLQLEFDDWNKLWVDLIFTIFFMSEFCLRAVLYTHIHNLYQESEEQTNNAAWVVERFKELKGKMFLRFIPPLPRRGWKEVAENLPNMLRDPMSLFDLVVILICLADNVIVAASGPGDASLASVSAFRVVRLLRLGIVLRVFAVFPKLQILLDAMIWTRRAIFWITCAMFCLVYATCSTIHVIAAGKDGKVTNPSVAPYFGDLYEALVSGWQLVTFDGWGNIVENTVQEFPGTAILFALLIGLGGLSLMNIGVAVMSEAAVRFNKEFEKKRQLRTLLKFLHQMMMLEQLIVDRLGCPILSVELIETALGVKITRRQAWGEDGPKFDEVVHSALMTSAQLVVDPEFIYQFQVILHDADLKPEFVKMIFERTDRECRGYVYVNAFTQGALSLKTDVMNIDILLSNFSLRSLRSLLHEVKRATANCQHLAGNLLEQACTLIHRRAPVGSKRKDGMGFILTESLGKAIDDLNSWRDEGVLPYVHATGTVRVVRGSGKLNFHMGTSTQSASVARRARTLSAKAANPEGGEMDKIRGVDTKFTQELEPGDYILVEDPTRGQVHALTVLSIQSATHLRCIPSAKIGKLEDAKFMIGKRVCHPSPGPSHRMDAPKPSVDLHGLLTSSPRNSEAFMAWELETRRTLANKVSKLKKEREHLTRQFEKLIGDICDLHLKDWMIEMMRAWRHVAKDLRTLKRQGESNGRFAWMRRHMASREPQKTVMRLI